MWKWQSLFKKQISASGSKITLPIDLLAPDFINNPYPSYEYLRKNHPVAAVKQGGILLTRHRDIQAALVDKNLGNSPSRFSVLAAKNKDIYIAANLAAHIPPFLDMPEHKLPRRAMSRAFYKTFDPWQSRLVVIADDIVNAALNKSGVLFLKNIARPFALRSMQEFCGFDHSDEYKELSTSFFKLFAPQTDPDAFKNTNNELQKFRVLVKNSLERSKISAKNNFISALLDHQATDNTLTDEQIIDLAILAFADGIENIEAATLSVFACLQKNNMLGNSIVESTIIEALRLETPAQIIPRIAKVDHQRHDILIKKDTPVWLALGSANRDSEVFDTPNIYSNDRALELALTFGYGRHGCIGAPLGKQQILTLLTALQNANAKVALNFDYQFRFGHRWPNDTSVIFS